MEKKHFNNVLFVGTGGGNDIFSTSLAALALQDLGWSWNECAFAGVLSPFHEHRHVIPLCTGAVTIQSNSERFVVNINKSFKIGFVDAAVANMVKNTDITNCKRVIGLSLHEGTQGLMMSFRLLAKKYDYVILVDVGGDIFYRGKQDHHVLSPMFDAMVLKGFIDSGVPGILFEAGPGTDGELEPEAIQEVLSLTDAQAFPLQKTCVDEWENLYKEWIAHIRTGRTVPMTIEAFNETSRIIEYTYRARAHMGKDRMYANFKQRIDTDLCKQFFLIEPSKIKNPFAVDCSNPISWFAKTQSEQHQTNCEANLEYCYYQNSLKMFLTPSPLFTEPERMYLIKKGLDELINDEYDKAIMFAYDWNKVKDNYPNRFEIGFNNNLKLIWKK